MKRWLESLTETNQGFDLSWVYDLANNRKLPSTPRFFTDNKQAILFEEESIVVWWLTTIQ
jgi:hypothetical protein